MYAYTIRVHKIHFSSTLVNGLNYLLIINLCNFSNEEQYFHLNDSLKFHPSKIIKGAYVWRSICGKCWTL